MRPGALQTRMIVLEALPRTRATLLLRLLGAGRVLAEAMADLEALPADAWERSIMMPLLVQFWGAGDGKPPPNEQEDDVTAETQAIFEAYNRRLRAEEAARAVLTVLRVRGIAVPDAARARILAEKDPERLERWHERAVVAASVAEVMDEPS